MVKEPGGIEEIPVVKKGNPQPDAEASRLIERKWVWKTARQDGKEVANQFISGKTGWHTPIQSRKFAFLRKP